MNQIAYTKIWQMGTGFTNQLFCLVTGIILAYNDKKKVLIIDDFHADIYKENSYIPISKIFDINKINEYLSQKYDIVILSKNDLDFKIRHVNYGHNENFYDLTDRIINLFYKNNTLRIPKNINMNFIKGDPCLGIQKTITIEYSLNNYNFTETFDEILKDHIVFDLNIATFRFIFGWVTRFNKTIFEDILSHIYYHSDYIKISEKAIDVLSMKKVNVIHLRLEDDAIKHWSKMNNMDETSFFKCIVNKYIEIIRTYIDKNDENIILSYLVDNEVVGFLRDNGYKYHFVEKNNEGREINAMIDFLIAAKCNNIFIGNHNPEKLNGSTFSYYISLMLGSNIKKILIDVDHIMDNEYLVT
jgi:hypothetical protein